MACFPFGCQVDVGVAADQSLGFEPGEEVVRGGFHVPRALKVFTQLTREAASAGSYWRPARTDVMRWVLKPSQCMRPT
jgi:hypothetical protein